MSLVIKQSAVEWFVESLRTRGVEWIAALCGHGLDPLFHACKKAGIQLVDVRNEQTAGYIAECFGRLARRPGVCACSSGVALANALTGVMNAWFDQAPMLCISGSAGLATLGMGCFQDSPQAALARPVTKYSRTIHTPQRAVQMLDEAWQAACTSPRGPVHLVFPMDIQRAEVTEADLVRSNILPHAPSVSTEALDSAAHALKHAKRPLIVTSSEIFYSGEGGDLLEAAERLRIPVQTPIWDRGICDTESEVFVGVTGAATGNPGLLAESDCVIAAGAAGDYRTGYWQGSRNVHHLERGWVHLPRLAGSLDFSPWLEEARAARTGLTAAIRAGGKKQQIPGRIHAMDVMDALGESLSADATLVIDGGSIGQWAHQLLTGRRYPGHWLTCGRSGVVGYGIGGAMAARLAFPGQPVVLLSGDGAFTFTVAELECAVRQKLPFVAVVADDQCWGITHAGHLRQFGEGLGTKLGAIPFASLAEALGARGVRVDQVSELAPAIRSAVASGEVTVIHVPISGGNPGV